MRSGLIGVPGLAVVGWSGARSRRRCRRCPGPPGRTRSGVSQFLRAPSDLVLEAAACCRRRRADARRRRTGCSRRRSASSSGSNGISVPSPPVMSLYWPAPASSSADVVAVAAVVLQADEQLARVLLADVDENGWFHGMYLAVLEASRRCRRSGRRRRRCRGRRGPGTCGVPGHRVLVGVHAARAPRRSCRRRCCAAGPRRSRRRGRGPPGRRRSGRTTRRRRSRRSAWRPTAAACRTTGRKVAPASSERYRSRLAGRARCRART